MITAIRMISGAAHPAIHRYRHLKAAAEIAQAGQPGFLGLEYEAVLRLLSDYEATLDLLAANEAHNQRQAEEDPSLPEPPATGKRLPAVIDSSPEAERYRDAMRSLIKEHGLTMDTRPDGLIRIHGYDVDLLVRDLINTTEYDFRR